MIKHYRDPFFNLFDEVIFTPYVKIEKNENEYKLFMSLPGLTKEDMKITINDGEMSISFKKELENKNHQFVNTFTKKYTIPDVINEEKIEGKVENGLLTINLPFKKQKRLERFLSLN
jgi:HSP20 family protein